MQTITTVHRLEQEVVILGGEKSISKLIKFAILNKQLKVNIQVYSDK